MKGSRQLPSYEPGTYIISIIAHNVWDDAESSFALRIENSEPQE